MLTGLALLFAATGCNHDPAVVKLATPSVSKAYYQQLSGAHTATVAVTLDSNGSVTDARIYQSTGDATLDNAAIDAAKRSTYVPGEVNCVTSGGTFAVEFSFQGEKSGPSDRPCPSNAQVVQLAPLHPGIGWDQLSGEVPMTVEVAIDANGKVTGAQVVQSTGIISLDQAEIDAARKSKYEPRLVLVPQTDGKGLICKPVSSRALVRFHFRP